MSKQTHQKYPPSVQHGIPRLAPVQKGWKSVAIGKLVTEVVRPVEMDDDATYTLVTAKRSRGGIVKREELKGREIAVKNQFYIQAGDFLISKRQIVHGACGFVPKELDGAIVSNEYLVLNFTDKVIPQFWEFLTHTIYFQQVCFHSSIGVHVEKMLFKVSRWYQWKVNIPTLKEQEKIASFLGAVDTRLTQLRRKHELLQTYKRGVMQKLFSQQIRFKGNDGQPFPDWEENTLENVASYRRGSFPQPYGLDKWYDDIYGEPFVQVYDVDDNLQLKSSTKRKISQEAIPFSVFVEKGSVILTIQGSIGRIAITQYDCYVDRTLLIFRTFLKPINKYFFIHIVLLLFEKEKEKAPGGTIKTITKEALSSFNLMLPCIEEQEKIADFLTAIDQKIDAISKQIELTERFKKGLLQKMFV